MLVYKYYVRPVTAESEQLALNEIALYVEARNRLVGIKRKWLRIPNDKILPEYQALAATLRVTPRVGRKPSKERNDRDELRALDTRTLYAEFTAANGSYATYWLADAAAKKAKHMLRSSDEGRAGLLPKQVNIVNGILNCCGTQWSIHPRQFKQRPLPPDTRIAQAWLQRERTSCNLLNRPRYNWYLVVVLDMTAPAKEVYPNRTVAGLDLAWRTDDDTLRVAYVVDDKGEHGPVRMMSDNYARLQHAESLQSLADQDANRLRQELGVNMNTSHKVLVERAPEHPITKHLIHLVDWHFGARRNALASRNAHYLTEIQELCKTYHTIYVEKIKATPSLVQKASTRKKKQATSDTTDPKGGVARDLRTLAAPFTFLRTLQQEAPKFGTKIVEVPPAYTTRFCTCGTDMKKSSKSIRRCPECGIEWDVDHLAAVNLLRWGQAQPEEASAAE